MVCVFALLQMFKMKKCPVKVFCQHIRIISLFWYLWWVHNLGKPKSSLIGIYKIYIKRTGLKQAPRWQAQKTTQLNITGSCATFQNIFNNSPHDNLYKRDGMNFTTIFESGSNHRIQILSNSDNDYDTNPIPSQRWS